jgi:exosortase
MGLAGAAAAALAMAYCPVLIQLVQDWIHDPNYTHGFLIPPVSVYLLRQRLSELRSTPPEPSSIGLLGVLGAGFVLVVGAAAAEVFTQRLSLVILLASAILFAAGWRWLKLVSFPLAFLLLAIPMPYVIYYGLTNPLQLVSSRLALVGLKLIGIPAVGEGNIIHLPQLSLEVAEACSGIRSLYAFLAVGALLARSMAAPLWARLLVFGVTLPLSVLGNAARVLGSGIGGHLFGAQATQGTPHEVFGVIVFALGLSLFMLIRRGAQRIWLSAS